MAASSDISARLKREAGGMTDTLTDIDLTPLLHPFASKNLQLKNRVLMAPMTRARSPGGVPTDEVARYYERRALGSVGFIMTEGVNLDSPASGNDRNVPNLASPAALEGWRRVVEVVHAAGAKIGCQLWHCGDLRDPAATAWPDVANQRPSGVDSRTGAVVAESMTEGECQEAIASFARGAAAGQAVGFDAVEVHCAHGYLLDQFLWKRTNRRKDRWGGGLPVDRAAFPAEVVRAVRMAVGPDYPIFVRLSQWKQQDFAARLFETPDDLGTVLERLTLAGADIFDCSLRRFWEPEFRGSELNLAGWAKRLTGQPVVAVGSVGLSDDFMSAFLRQGSSKADLADLSRRMTADEFDLIAVGRALLTDPSWLVKVSAGRFDEVLGSPPEAIDVYF